MEEQLAPTARVVVTASSVHNPATGDPGKQATLGPGISVFQGVEGHLFRIFSNAFHTHLIYKYMLSTIILCIYIYNISI